MTVNFNELKEQDIRGMNGGNGTLSAKMLADKSGKLIACRIRAGSPSECIGMKQATTSATFFQEQAQPCATALKNRFPPTSATSAKKARRTALRTPAQKISCCSRLSWSINRARSAFCGGRNCFRLQFCLRRTALFLVSGFVRTFFKLRLEPA